MSLRKMSQKSESESQRSQQEEDCPRNHTHNLRRTRSSTNTRKKTKKSDYYYPTQGRGFASGQNSPDSCSPSAREREDESAKNDLESSRPSEKSTIKTRNLRSSNKLRSKALNNVKPKRRMKRKTREPTGKKNDAKRQRMESEGDQESNDCEIPSNLNPLFEVFCKFIEDLHVEASNEVEETTQQPQQNERVERDQEVAQMNELQQFYDSLGSTIERRLCQHFVEQNITDPATIRAYIDAFLPQILAQHQEAVPNTLEEMVEGARRASDELNDQNQDCGINNTDNDSLTQDQHNYFMQQMLREKLSELLQGINQNNMQQNQIHPMFDPNNGEIYIRNIFDFKRSSYHIGAATFIQQIQRASHQAYIFKAQQMALMQRNEQNNIHEERTQNNNIQQEMIEAQQDSIQEQLIPALLQSQLQEQTTLPDLNTVSASQIQNSHQIQPGLEEARTATQKQLAELCQILNQRILSSNSGL
ncbi:unnamed protein product [Moneuplotes crassus]|uniref:Uncharacterized protein n=1 Tax=Euplotes crassus TaxID=5936 RepID=A0AAD1X8U1_EUPCR|nr:unnamed protein product [Moneuplotes crassus]